MTPILSNPSLPGVKTLLLSHPFGGVYRRNIMPQPEGNLWYLHRCSLQDRTIAALPGYIDPTYTMTKMGWAGVEQTRGVVNDPAGGDFWVVTSERVHRYSFGGDPITYLGNLGTGTKAGTDITIPTPTYPLQSGGLMKGAKLFDGTDWHEVQTIPSDTVITTTGVANNFTNKAVFGYNRGFTGYNSGFYGPRYCWFGEQLIMVSLWGTCVYPFSSTQDYLGPITMKNRGIDIVNFAGRPVLIGAYETVNDYSADNVSLYSDMLRWPTRSDNTDWDSYGSGFLFLHSDGAGIRCGTNWGEDAYVFTGTSIYQLVETGMSASNPIAFQKHPARLVQPPISNCVQGIRGIYFWTKNGPAMFDGNVVHDLTLNLEVDIDTWSADLLSDGVHVWADRTTRTIRFHQADLEAVLLQYIFWEDTGAWTTLDEDHMYLAGTGELYGGKVGIKSTSITTDTDISRIQEQLQGTEDMSSTDFLARATWRGITMQEGPHINKTIQQIRVLFEITLTGDFLKCSMVPDVKEDTVPDANTITVSPTPSEDLQWHTFTNMYTKQAPVWRLDLQIPPGAKIYMICIDYSVAGDVEGPLT